MLIPSQEYAGHLLLRAVRDEHDIARYVALSRTVVNEHEGQLAERVLRRRPGQSLDDFLLVEDTCTGQVVSTTNLMPWQVRFETETLNAAMLEMVVTHPDYRRRGLVRAQMQRFHQAVAERGFDFSIIQGIPYYYRQYGYAYALDHQPRDVLPAHRIPDGPVGHRLRPAQAGDAPLLTRLHHEALANAQLCVVRGEDDWLYLLQTAHWPVQIVQDVKGAPVGYVVASSSSNGLDISEGVALDGDAALAALSLLRSGMASEGEMSLAGTPVSGLVRAARALGSTPHIAYQWLVSITNLPGFLMRIAPVLTRRLAASEFAGFSSPLTINLFREAFVLQFERGELVAVAPAGFVDTSMGADGGDLCIPPDAFVRLIFGYRALDELRDAWPDLSLKPHRSRLFESLFPRLASLVWMPY